MGNSKGIVIRLRIETIGAAKYPNIKDIGSSTIESIAIEKYYSEEASRVHYNCNGNGRLCVLGNKVYSEDIV